MHYITYNFFVQGPVALVKEGELMNSCIFTHPAVKKQHCYSFQSHIFSHHQLLRKKSRSSASLCACLLSGTEQVLYSGFLKVLHWKQVPARAAILNQNSKVVGGSNFNELKLTIKFHKAEEAANLW